MNPVKIVKKIGVSGYGILLAAIAVSLLWHIFWLSALKIVSSPLRKEAVNFSKVSFLGPILSRVSMEVRAAPAAQSLLERRYHRLAEPAQAKHDEASAGSGSERDSYGPAKKVDMRLSLAIDEAVSVDKLEPDYPVE